MTTNKIDLRTMPRNVPSLCIPRVFPNIDERRIRRVFEELNMGEIERVDIVKKTTEKGDKFNRVFIHWKAWNSSDNANQARERLLNGKEIKIVYDEPWFWKISAYRDPVSRQENKPPSTKRPVARISFDDDEDRSRHDDRQRPRHDDRQRPRHDDRQRPRHDDRQRPIQKPTTPDCSPPRIREDENQDNKMTSPDQFKIDYGNLPPPPKKLAFKTKKPIVVEEEV